MNVRSWQVLKGLLLVIVAGVLTWLLSWLMQYVGELTIPGQHFHLNQESNRLAFVTVLATVVVMIAVVLLVVLDGCATFFIILFAGAAIVTGIGSVAVHTFPGTTIVTGARAVDLRHRRDPVGHPDVVCLLARRHQQAGWRRRRLISRGSAPRRLAEHTNAPRQSGAGH